MTVADIIHGVAGLRLDAAAPAKWRLNQRPLTGPPKQRLNGRFWVNADDTVLLAMGIQEGSNIASYG